MPRRWLVEIDGKEYTVEGDTAPSEADARQQVRAQLAAARTKEPSTPGGLPASKPETPESTGPSHQPESYGAGLARYGKELATGGPAWSEAGDYLGRYGKAAAYAIPSTIKGLIVDPLAALPSSGVVGAVKTLGRNIDPRPLLKELAGGASIGSSAEPWSERLANLVPTPTPEALGGAAGSTLIPGVVRGGRTTLRKVGQIASQAPQDIGYAVGAATGLGVGHPFITARIGSMLGRALGKSESVAGAEPPPSAGAVTALSAAERAGLEKAGYSPDMIAKLEAAAAAGKATPRLPAPIPPVARRPTPPPVAPGTAPTAAPIPAPTPPMESPPGSNLPPSTPLPGQGGGPPTTYPIGVGTRFAPKDQPMTPAELRRMYGSETGLGTKIAEGPHRLPLQAELDMLDKAYRDRLRDPKGAIDPALLRLFGRGVGLPSLSFRLPSPLSPELQRALEERNGP